MHAAKEATAQITVFPGFVDVRAFSIVCAAFLQVRGEVHGAPSVFFAHLRAG